MHTFQLSLSNFTPDSSGGREVLLYIDRIYIAELRMHVPYLSVPEACSDNLVDAAFVNRFGRVPYALPAKEPEVTYANWDRHKILRRRTKMLWFRRHLPDCSIRQQYAEAELRELRGYSSLRAIESGAVIRALRTVCIESHIFNPGLMPVADRGILSEEQTFPVSDFDSSCACSGIF